MPSRIRAAMATAATGVLAASALTAGAVVTAAPVTAAERRADITARPSDSAVQSGEQFVVRGRFTIDGTVAAGRTVKIQAKYGQDWQPITGARVTTNTEGKYRVRIILSQKGDRELRSVGLAPAGIKNAYERFSIQVS